MHWTQEIPCCAQVASNHSISPQVDWGLHKPQYWALQPASTSNDCSPFPTYTINTFDTIALFIWSASDRRRRRTSPGRQQVAEADFVRSAAGGGGGPHPGGGGGLRPGGRRRRRALLSRWVAETDLVQAAGSGPRPSWLKSILSLSWSEKMRSPGRPRAHDELHGDGGVPVLSSPLHSSLSSPLLSALSPPRAPRSRRGPFYDSRNHLPTVGSRGGEPMHEWSVRRQSCEQDRVGASSASAQGRSYMQLWGFLGIRISEMAEITQLMYMEGMELSHGREDRTEEDDDGTRGGPAG
uniref:Uncharacterized protein n=1 Tax=Oryza rufipogon TaxID=4529 RepID=A0A0E0MSL3_ORYRU